MRDLEATSVGSNEGAQAVLTAIAAVSDDPAHPRVQVLLAHVAGELGVELGSIDPAALAAAAIDPAALAAAVVEAAHLAVFQRLAIAAMLVPPITAARLDRLEACARALGQAKDPALKDLRRLLAGSRLALSSGLLARFPPSERLKAAWRRGSLGDKWRFLKAMAKIGDAGTAARYRALGEYPEGTLGRAFFDHCRQNNFPLPGEKIAGKSALPEAAAFHDMGHALLGVGTDVGGEAWIAGFEAGTMGDRGFVMIEFTLMLFNLGAPLPTDARPEVDQVDLAALFEGFARGRAGGLDVLRWDPWADVSESLGELRARYGLHARA